MGGQGVCLVPGPLMGEQVSALTSGIDRGYQQCECGLGWGGAWESAFPTDDLIDLYRERRHVDQYAALQRVNTSLDNIV